MTHPVVTERGILAEPGELPCEECSATPRALTEPPPADGGRDGGEQHPGEDAQGEVAILLVLSDQPGPEEDGQGQEADEDGHMGSLREEGCDNVVSRCLKVPGDLVKNRCQGA